MQPLELPIYEEGSEVKAGVSHVTGEYVRQAINSEQSLFSERFIIRPDKLLSNNMKKLLAQTLALEETELAEKLQQDFMRLSQNLHSKRELDDGGQKISNSADRRIKAGIADIIPLGRLRGKEVRPWAENMLKQKEEGKTIRQIIAEETDTIICSEFAAKMTVLTLAALDKELTQAIQEKNPTFVRPSTGIIRFPFGHKEDLSKITPERLVKQLQRADAIEKIDNLGIIQSVIK